MKLYQRNGFFILAASITEAHRACRRMSAEPGRVGGLMPGAGRITLADTTPAAEMEAAIAAGYVGVSYILTIDGVVHTIHPGDSMPVARPREWAVIGMDGEIVGRYASKSAAQRVAEDDSGAYAAGRPDGDRSYLPRSVAHLACGTPRRQGPHSTAWAVGCIHEWGSETD